MAIGPGVILASGLDQFTNPSTTWTAIGNVVTSTSQSKFGPSSMYVPFNLLQSAQSIQSSGGDETMFDVTTGPFTIEFFVYWPSTTITGGQDIMGLDILNGLGIITYLAGTSSYIQIISRQYLTPVLFEYGTFTLVLDTWQYFCVQRSLGGTINIWLNGIPLTLTNTGAGTYNFASYAPGAFCRMGAIDGSAGGMKDAYLDEVLITRGYAKYPTTGNIGVPTQPFSVRQFTSQLMHMDGTNGAQVFTNDQG